jgi:hypothetical protein
MQLDENRMRDLVIDHEEKRILNEIKWELKQFYYKRNRKYERHKVEFLVIYISYYHCYRYVSNFICN